MLKPLLTLLAGVLCLASASAQVELNPDHPQEYTVVRGDTLWDISGRFLRKPWLWPEIWQANPQIENPHLIYPGDVISLSFVDGEPRLSLRRGERPTYRLGPEVRRTPLSDAIEPIDLSQIRPFLDKRTVLSGDEVERLPYVLEIEEGFLAGTEGQQIYVRGLEGAAVGDRYAVASPTVIFKEVPSSWPFDMAEEFTPVAESWSYPAEKSISDFLDDFWQATVLRSYNKNTRILGYEVVQTATADVLSVGDPSVLRITGSVMEVQPGDLVIRSFSADYDLEYFPRSGRTLEDGMYVIGLSRTLFGAGRNQVVAINRGAADGIENGHVYSIHRPSRVMRDEIRYPRDDVQTFFSKKRRRAAKVTIPEEYVGHLMVFRTFDDVSYALIVRSANVIKLGDVLRAP